MTTSIAGSWKARLAGNAEPESRQRGLTQRDLSVLHRLSRTWARPLDIEIDGVIWALRKLYARGLVERQERESLSNAKRRNFEYRLKIGH